MNKQKYTKRRDEDKKIDVNQVVSYLNHAFTNAIRGRGSNNTKGTKLYEYQTEFCYLINEIQRGPSYIVPKIIQDANELIDTITQENKGE